MSIHLALLFFIVGLIIWALATQPKPAEVGRCLMWCGLLAWLLGKGYAFIPWLN